VTDKQIWFVANFILSKLSFDEFILKLFNVKTSLFSENIEFSDNHLFEIKGRIVENKRFTNIVNWYRNGRCQCCFYPHFSGTETIALKTIKNNIITIKLNELPPERRAVVLEILSE
jgi:hypothetical protein